jgi:hypothetical protein
LGSSFRLGTVELNDLAPLLVILPFFLTLLFLIPVAVLRRSALFCGPFIRSRTRAGTLHVTRP